MRNSSKTCRYNTLGTVRAAKKKASNTCLYRAQATGLGAVPFTFGHWMQNVAPTDCNVMLVSMPGLMDSGFVTQHNRAV
jgi:hypothetical protein